MTILDKNGVLSQIDGRSSVVLELGCGAVKNHPEAISVDKLDYPSVDVVGDVMEVLSVIGDSTVHAIHSSHFLEHVDDLERLLQEIVRVLAPGAKLEVSVPHHSNPYYYSDPTHKNFFGLYTFSYFCHDAILSRRVPHYGEPLPLELRRVHLCFKAAPPFYFRYAFKRLVGFLVNLTTYSKEFYEENLCGLFPCYGLEYSLVRLSGGGSPSSTRPTEHGISQT